MRISRDEYFLGIALSVSKRSTCLKRHYGAIIVKDGVIVATGFNGNPSGMEHCCEKGECSRLNKPHNSGDYSDCYSVHAEQNAIIQCSYENMKGATLYLAGEERRYSEINQSFFDWKELKDSEPCPICARMIVNSGIKRVVNKNGDVDIKCLL